MSLPVASESTSVKVTYVVPDAEEASLVEEIADADRFVVEEDRTLRVLKGTEEQAVFNGAAWLFAKIVHPAPTAS